MRHLRVPRLILALLPILLTACAASQPPATRASAPISVDLNTFQFKFDPDNGTINDIPQWIRDLDGRDIIIQGYMIPLDESEHITHFVLVPVLAGDDTPSNLQQIIDCKMLPGKYLTYDPQRLYLHGKMHVAIVKEEDSIVTLFTLDTNQVDPIPDTH